MFAMKDEDLKIMAKNRVEFRDHLYAYVFVNAILIAINLWVSPQFWWFLFVLVFWGIGLFFHYREAYCGNQVTRIEREYKKLKSQNKGKK